MGDYDHTLGAGTIGGNGIWIGRQCDWPCSTTWSLHGDSLNGRGGYYTFVGTSDVNSGLANQRLLADAAVLNEQLLSIGAESPLEHFWAANTDPTFHWQYQAGEYALWTAIGVSSGRMLWGRSLSNPNQPYGAIWADVVGATRHAGRVLLQSLDSPCMISAERIALGDAGYTDTLPGLFQVSVIPGTVDPGVSAQVTVTPYSNPRIGWVLSEPSVIRVNREMDFGTVGHPYCRYSDDPITVDLSADNANTHVIPGVSIEFESVPCGSGVVSVGFEWVNGGEWVDAWRSGYYLPQSAEGPSRNNWIVTRSGGDSVNYHGPERGRAHWWVYNVSGGLLEGCQVHIVPLVRLEQADNALAPFRQWYMGYAAATALPESRTPYTLTVYNVHSVGYTRRISLACSYGLDMTVREINPTTMQPTGTVHSNADDLIANNSTLYRWDAMGVYFVPAYDTTEGMTALVWVRPGTAWSKYVSRGTVGSPYIPTLHSGPDSFDVGGWGAYDIGGVIHHASGWMPPAHYTGAIQAQGYDLVYSNTSVHPTNTHWYNHCVPFTTWGTFVGTSLSIDDNPLEWAVMVTCDDPRYFQVIPMTALFAASEWKWLYDERGKPIAYTGDPGTNGYEDWYSERVSHGSALGSRPGTDQMIRCSAVAQSVSGNLIVRLNGASAAMAQLLRDHGVEVE